MNVQLQCVNIIEGFTREAFALSSTDPPLGTVLAKSLELMIKVVRDGVESPSLGYAIGSMQRERDYAKESDLERNDPIRHIVYGMSESIEWMIKALIEKNVEAVESRQADYFDQQERASNSQNHLDLAGLLLPTVKDEPLDRFTQATVDDTEDKAVTGFKESMQSDRSEQPRMEDGVDPSQYDELDDIYNDNEEPQSSRKGKRARYDEDGNYDNEGNTAPRINAKVGNDPNKHICYLCNKSFNRPAKLKEHMKTHTGEQKLPCSHCHRTFIRNADLKNHLRTKHGLAQYECSTCAARFGKMEELREHWQREGHKTEKEKREKRISANKY